MRRAVVPLVRARHAVVRKRVADRLPRQTAVVGALDLLAEPRAGLRCVEAVRRDRRALDVVDFPAREVRAADVPTIALAVRRQDEGSLARPHENPNATHAPSSYSSGGLLRCFRTRHRVSALAIGSALEPRRYNVNAATLAKLSPEEKEAYHRDQESK